MCWINEFGSLGIFWRSAILERGERRGRESGVGILYGKELNGSA
jgi:hypothetical protein